MSSRPGGTASVDRCAHVTIQRCSRGQCPVQIAPTRSPRRNRARKRLRHGGHGTAPRVSSALIGCAQRLRWRIFSPKPAVTVDPPVLTPTAEGKKGGRGGRAWDVPAALLRPVGHERDSSTPNLSPGAAGDTPPLSGLSSSYPKAPRFQYNVIFTRTAAHLIGSPLQCDLRPGPPTAER